MPALTTTERASKQRIPAVVKLLVMATFVVILNETIMANAIAPLTDSWQITEQMAQWVSTVFMLTMASVIPITGWFLQRVSTKRAYGIAMGVFLLGTAVAAAAPWFWVLLLGRVIQAAGTAVMLPLLMTTLMTVVPENDRGRVMGNVTMAISVAPALGPALSGVILQFGSWRMLFVVVFPIAAAITWFGLRRIENVGSAEQGSIDWFSVVMAALGFGGLVYGLSQFGDNRPASGAAIVAAGAVVIVIFVVRQLRLQRSDNALMDLRTLNHRTYALSLALMTIAFMAMIGTMLLLPLYLQKVRHLSPLETGMLVMPGGLLMGLLGPSVGKLFDRFGGRLLVIPGALGVVTSLGGLTFISATMPFWLVLALHVLLMVSLAALFTPVFTLGLGVLPPHLYSHGSSILGTLQQVGGAVGTALSVTVMAARASSLTAGGASEAAAKLGGMQVAFGVSAALSIVVVLVALVLPGRAPSGDAPVREADGGPEELELQPVCAEA